MRSEWDSKYFFGSHHAFPSHDGNERPSHGSRPHIEANSIRNLISHYKQGKHTQSPTKNESHVPNLPSRGNGPSPSTLHEFVFRPRPISHTMSENSTLRRPSRNTSHQSPLPHGSNVKSSAVSQGQHASTLGPPGELEKKGGILR